MQMHDRRYNSWGFDVTMPDKGWISMNQLYDPAWKVTVDGQPVPLLRANFLRSAIPVSAGQHQIRLEYWPFTRRIYWFAAAALELILIFLGVVAVREYHVRNRRAETV